MLHPASLCVRWRPFFRVRPGVNAGPATPAAESPMNRAPFHFLDSGDIASSAVNDPSASATTSRPAAIPYFVVRIGIFATSGRGFMNV
jgi:hypothetical protein